MKKYLIYLLAVFMLAVPAGFLFADAFGDQCDAIAESGVKCPDMATCQKCSDYYDQQSAKLAQDLTKTSAQKNTLQSAISKLKTKIQGLEADIKQGTIMVKDLDLQISDTQVSINKTTADIQDSQNQIETILRAVYEEDRKPAFVVLLEGDLSDFFSNLAYLDNLNTKICDLLNSTRNLKLYLQGQQIKMGENVDQLQKTIALQTLQKKQNEQNQQQQNQYLKLTEAQYQQQLKDKQAIEQKATKIKSMLFQVAGVTKAPTFGQAIEVAKAVSNIIPIRPALLLAVLSQESALGKNVGTCLLTNKTTGEGKRVSTGAYMPKVFNKNGYHPNDLAYFLQITSSVGRDPLNSMISCDGYGSMGPAQFLPATWKIFIDRLKDKLGHTADPWAVQDSFAASAMYLYDLQKKYGTEALAAQHYNGSGSAAVLYSKQVIKRAACVQTFIDNSTMDSSCQSLILGI